MYIISQQITEEIDGLWFEGKAYQKQNLYSIQDDSLPPVNYDSHIINAHSLTHIETPKHTQKDGKTIDWYYENATNHFYGKCTLIKLKGNHYKEISSGLYHWEVSLLELKDALGGKKPHKLLLTTDFYPKNSNDYHDPSYVLTLSIEAAEYLVQIEGFDLFGTSWKSSDFKPGAKDRPVHNKIFEKALIMECLKLDHVNEGDYELTAFPLNIKGASESPVTAILR